MNLKYLIIFVISILELLMESISASNNTKDYIYKEFDIENFLLPLPYQINKGTNNFFIGSIKKLNFTLVDNGKKTLDSSKSNRQDHYIYESIIKLYTDILSSKNNFGYRKTKVNMAYFTDLIDYSTSNTVENSEEQVLNGICNIEIELKNIQMLKFSDFFVDNYEKIESYNLKIDFNLYEKTNPKKEQSSINDNDIDNNNNKIRRQRRNDENLIYLNVKISVEYLNGLLRALETLSQIINFNKIRQKYQIFSLPIEIFDKPSFPYRGIMIDTSRHFVSENKVLEILDGMLYSKLNILHWHLTDDEYFSINFEDKDEQDDELQLSEINKFFAYKKSQIKKILKYALIRGITIIPEIDHPAHTRSWQFNSKNPEIKDILIANDEYGILNPSKNKTYKMINKIIEKTASLFKIYENSSNDSKHNGYIHLGGDEIQKSFWDRNDIKQFMKDKKIENITDLENYFFNRVFNNLQESLAAYSIDEVSNIKKSEEIKKLIDVNNSNIHDSTTNNFLNKNSIYTKNFIYWVDESVERFYDIYFTEQSVFIYWGMHNNITSFMDSFIKAYNERIGNNNYKLTNKDNNLRKKIIISSGDYLYMDCGFGNKYGDKTWCGDVKTWKKIYQISLMKKYQMFDILGAQITLFGELADDNSIIGKLFPRAFSIAEKLWNFDHTKNLDDDKIKSLFVRINNMNKRFNIRNVGSLSITTQLCENESQLCLNKIKNKY